MPESRWMVACADGEAKGYPWSKRTLADQSVVRLSRDCIHCGVAQPHTVREVIYQSPLTKQEALVVMEGGPLAIDQAERAVYRILTEIRDRILTGAPMNAIDVSVWIGQMVPPA